MNSDSLPKKIGLFGPWGYGNLGCAATQDAMIQNIRKRIPEAEIYGFSLVPQDTEKRHGIPSYTIGRDNWDEYQIPGKILIWKFADWLQSRSLHLFQKMGCWVRRAPFEITIIKNTIRRLKKLDLLIVSGGGQLLDFWGGAWTHPYWLVKYAILSKLTGTKFMFVSVGAGPVSGKLSRFFCKTALSLSDYRSYRDIASKTFVERVIGFKNNDPVYPDLAYSLHIKDSKRGDARRPIVALGVMAFDDPRHWPEKDLSVYLAYLNKLASFASWLIERQYMISTIVGESQADRLAVKDFIKILHNKDLMSLGWKQVREINTQSVSDLLEQISQADFVVASRFHNVLLSTILNKPVIALSYHPKIDSLMKISKQECYCLPIDKFEVENLKELFIDLQANCENIKKQFEELTRGNRIALDEQYDRIFANL